MEPMNGGREQGPAARRWRARAARRWRGGAAGLSLLLLAGGVAAACALTNVKHDACTGDDQCAAAFGAGSTCASGFCTDPMAPGGCQKMGADGRSCFSCMPVKTQDFENACTGATCVPFDDSMRVTKLTADGGLPPLP